ncbi:MAG: ribonuclease R [Verrucomicrobiales bacterium]|nr:ribonuclease R [Verrucomicrobiales bacterium]
MKKNFIEAIRARVKEPDYQPMNKSEMARDLGVPSDERAELRAALVELEARGELLRGKKARYRVPEQNSDGDLIRGHLQMSNDRKRRSAFFVPEDPASSRIFRDMERPRVFVPGRFTSTALDGDTVDVKIQRGAPPKWHKHSPKHRARMHDDTESLQARVVEVVERSGRPIVGIYHGKGARATVAPEDGRLPASFRLMSLLPDAKPGDIVVASFTEWSDVHLPPMAEMVKVLGREDAPGVDILKVIHRYGLPLEFPETVLAEADLIDEVVSEEEIARREDWREREVFTIDPEDAKDFDDAICVTEKSEGGWELAVHIADVSHYVKPDSALDKEARKRGNSVYLADRVIPMLPEKLSNGVCSLKPHVERLTHAAVMDFDSCGNMTKARFVSAVIRSHHRYTYEQAYEQMMLTDEEVEAIEDEKQKQLTIHLKRAWLLGSLLRERRYQNGALDLDFAEVRVVLDEEGRAIGVKRSVYDESHQLIEEFMLAANEAVACETKNAPAPSIYRVHEDPDPGKLEEFADLARSFGHRVGDVTHRPELQKLLQSIKGNVEEHSIKVALLRSLRRADYRSEPMGHYGLAKTNYTHFTSPIRRYADLVVHRVLRRILSKRGEATAPDVPGRTPTAAEMGDISYRISRTERVAAEAEMETQRLKMIEYLERTCREDPDAAFDATVLEVRPIGAFVELNDLMIKGLIRKEDLSPRDEYFFDRIHKQFKSRCNAPTLATGRTVSVQLLRVNHIKGFIDFVPVEAAPDFSQW